MKILKHGKEYYAIPKGIDETTCPSCSCLFEYDEEDLKLDKHFKDNKWAYSYYVVCPECYEHIGVSDDE